MIRRIQLAPLVLALGLISGSAHAALQGRDLNGSLDSFEAYYDTDRDITWLADANYAKTSGYAESRGYGADGQMNWAVAKIWAADLSLVDAVNNITYDNWRLPTVIDTGTPGCNFANTGTDCGSNVDTATGEMAHLFYDELGNKAYYGTSGNPQSGFGLTNTGPFTHLQAGNYWSGSEAASEAGPYSGSAWLFDFGFGHQGTEFTQSAFYYSHLYDYYALAVSPGDVGAVPEAQTYALMLAGLGLIGWRARRRG